MKGLKQLVSDALAEKPEPVEVSDEARHALATKMREWSGWRNARVRFGDPMPISPWAHCNTDKQEFIVNIDGLILNPNRVLLTVTPFRLKQEAVLSGIMLHEAGHARHSGWIPDGEFLHGEYSEHEGEPVTAQTIRLARLMEEPRVEGLMARNAVAVGADGLEWTMRAAAAKIAPLTNLSVDPGQRIMDLITSWTLRAGRQMVVQHWVPGYVMPQWVSDFTSLLHGALIEHLVSLSDDDAGNEAATAQKIIQQMLLMMVSVDDRGTYAVDSARAVLDMLFPETDGNDPDAPQAGDPHAVPAPPEKGNGDNEESEAGDDESTGEGDESGEQGEGNTEPEDEGSGDDPGAGDSGDDDAEPENPESGDGDAEADGPDEGDEAASETDEDGAQSDDDAEGGDEAQPSDDEPADSGSGDSPVSGDSDTEEESDLAKALRALEEDSRDQTEDEAESLAESQGKGAGGAGDNEGLDPGWRNPTKPERETQKEAEKFLRDQIAPSEASKVQLTDQPSATVDGAALAAWRAGGERRAPEFFRRTRRMVEPSPPVKIAVLVDVSASMDELQEPSALLSWALSAAALDLRNFAGRGQQIESCLIHWGNTARVIQPVGAPLPGLKEFHCSEGTSAMHEAYWLVEQQMPGFFDVQPTPVNRLLVNFTDWELYGRARAGEYVERMLAGGVHMLTVAPASYSPRRSVLPDILRDCTVQRGRHALVKYNPAAPGAVWDTAATMLDGRAPAPFTGF